MLAGGDEAPLVGGAACRTAARVFAEIVEQTRGQKMLVFKKKRRKNHRRTARPPPGADGSPDRRHQPRRRAAGRGAAEAAGVEARAVRRWPEAAETTAASDAAKE